MRRNLLLGVAMLGAFGFTGPKARAQTVVVSLSAPAYAVGETNASVAMVVNRGGGTNVAFTVDYATTNGTALAGQDYVAQSGTLAFAAGVNSRVLTIPILDDGLVEGDETFTVQLSNPSGGAVLGPQSTATLVIHDNEMPSLLDVSFDPGSGFDNDVFALASQPDGKILAAGQFTSFNTSNRTRIARLNADGSLDQSFDPGTGADGDIYVVAWQPDGKVLVGGAFTTVNGTGNRYVARLNADGSVDDTFAPGSSVNNDLRALAVQPDGKILIAGRFTTVAGQTRNRIARLNEDGTLDTTFNPGTGANNNVRSMALQVDGRILIGGQFTTVNGTSRVRVARLLSNGLLDASFNPGSGADDQVRALAVRGDGMIYIGGDFEIYNGTNRSAVARLFANGGLDLSFDQGNPSDDTVRTLLPLADGSVWIGGAFQTSGGQPRANLAWLDASGVATQAGTPPLAVDDEVFTLLADAHGRLLAGGKFAHANGVARRRVARWWQNPSVNTFEFTSAVFQGNEVAGQAIISVRRNGESSNTVSVVCATADGTATAGADYSAQTQTLNFGPLETIKTFVVPIQNDGVAEGTETVRLTLDQASPGIVPGPGAVLEITDDAGRIGFAVSAVDIGEAAGSIVLAVTRTGNASQAVSVDFYTTNGTAISGVDYVAQAGTLTFAPGVTTLYLPVPILNDALQETNESFSVTLAHPTGGGVFGPLTNVAVTIIDNELGLGFTGTYRIIDESFSSVRLSVIKQWDTTNRVLVDYATGDGTATAGLDYVAQSGTLAFEPGEFEKGIDIILLKDALHEDAEGFAVILGNVRGGVTLKISSIDVIIACESECDTGIEFDLPVYAVAESGGSVTLGVRRGDDVTNTFTVQYWTSNGTAIAGIDYLPQSGTLTLLPGVINHDLIIPVFRDTSFLSAKTFSVHLGNPSPGIELGTRQTTIVKIVDDYQPGMVDTNFNPTEDFPDLNAVTSQPDGKVVVGFGARSYGTPVARLNSDGTRDSGFTPGVPSGFFNVSLGLITSVTLDSQGRILCGGLGGVPDLGWSGWSLRRFDADGSNGVTLSEGFMLPPFYPVLYCIHVQADGKIIEGGGMGFAYDPTAYMLLRFNADGSPDSAFQSPRGGVALTIASQADGKILVGGLFSEINGSSRNGLARLLADGTLDASFYGSGPTNGCNGDVRAIVPLPDGKILLAGGFTIVHGVSRLHLARLNPDGSLDLSFPAVPPPDARIFAMALEGDGRILIAGEFMTVGGLSRPRVARLNADGSVDETFDPGTGPNAPVYGMALLPDGDVVIIGSFSSVDGVARPQIARLKTYVLRFDPPARLPGGHIRLVVHGRPATRFILQASTDLQNWSPLSTNSFITTTSEFTDTIAAPGVSRFYRALSTE